MNPNNIPPNAVYPPLTLEQQQQQQQQFNTIYPPNIPQSMQPSQLQAQQSNPIYPPNMPQSMQPPQIQQHQGTTSSRAYQQDTQQLLQLSNQSVYPPVPSYQPSYPPSYQQDEEKRPLLEATPLNPQQPEQQASFGSYNDNAPYFSPEQLYDLGYPLPTYEQSMAETSTGSSSSSSPFTYTVSPFSVPFSPSQKVKDLTPKQLQEIENFQLKLQDMIVKKNFKGVESSDLRVTNPEEILKFFQYNNSAPISTILVRGWHTEWRNHRVSYTDSNGRRQTRNERRSETVYDFNYSIDLSDIIIPYGYICVEGGKDFDTVLKEFQMSSKSFKELRMKKEVVWQYETARSLITSRLRELGYPHNIVVDFKKSNYRVVLRSKNAEVYASRCVKFLCVMSCLWICALPWKRRNAEPPKLINSCFRTTKNANEWFEQGGRNFINTGGWSPSINLLSGLLKLL
eukprot:Awhi_evm2s13823